MLCWGWNLAQAPSRPFTARGSNASTNIVRSSLIMEQANIWASTGTGGSFRSCDLRSPVPKFRGLLDGNGGSSSSSSSSSKQTFCSSQSSTDWPGMSSSQQSFLLPQMDDSSAHSNGTTAVVTGPPPGTVSSNSTDPWALKHGLELSAQHNSDPQLDDASSSPGHDTAAMLHAHGCAPTNGHHQKSKARSEQPHRKRLKKSWEPRQHISTLELSELDDKERQLMRAITSTSTSIQIQQLFDAPGMPLNTRHLSAMMHQLAVLHTSQRRQRLSPEEATMVKSLLEDIRQDHNWFSDSLGPWELTTILWAIVKLDYPCGKLFVTQALALAKRRFRYYTAQGLAELLWVVAKSGMRTLRPDWAKDYCQALRREAGSLSPQGVAMVLYSMALLGYTPSETTHILLLDRLLSLLLDGLCKPADVSMSLWGLGHFVLQKPAPACLLEVIHGSQNLLPDFSAQELSNCIWGIAKLQLTPTESWMGAFYSASLAHVPSANPQSLSNILYAVALMHQRPPQQWMQLYILTVTRTLHTFTLQGLAVVVYSMGLVAYHPGMKWLQYFHAQLGRFEDSMDSKTTDMISSAYQRLHFSPHVLLSDSSQGPPAPQSELAVSTGLEQLRTLGYRSSAWPKLSSSGSTAGHAHVDELLKPSRFNTATNILLE